MFNSHLAYLLTIIIFAGVPLLIEWSIAWKKLRVYKVLISIVVALNLVWAVVEAPALWLKAWQYNDRHVIHSRPLGAQLETYVFVVFTSLAVACATLILTKREDDKKR